MTWFLNRTTKTKLFLVFGLMVFFLACVIAAAYTSITAIQKSQSDLFRKDFLPSTELIELRSDQNRVRAQLLEMMIIKDRAKQKVIEEDVRARAKEVEEGLNRISAALKEHPLELKKLEELITVRVSYMKSRDEQIALIYKGRIEEAQQLGTTIQEERYNRIRSIAKELGDGEIAQAEKRIEQAEKNARTLLFIFISAGALALLLSVGLTLFLSRIIARPLNELKTTAELIAAGDLSVTVISDERRDEIGALTRAFSAMTRYLREMADVAGQIAARNLSVKVEPQSGKDVLGNAFAAMISNLRDVMTEIQKSAGILASSVSEILATTTQVASGMAETATSVSETTATVEEVKQTALLSSEKSRGVSENSQKAVQVAQQGNAAVGETVEGINHIRRLMESVAASIVKLSEQTQAIGEIITTVNDLAQQSNLLSVNAAIEASKAGEQGKGFTVVAQEIKSLADQSKQATEQVRTILSDIQKATGAAVMASEQVSKAVDGGVKQSNEAGESIRKLWESITEAAQTAIQIAASSQQQLAGMEQVALAMENIKQATQQNVAGTKQAERAAHDLNELGQKLKEMVEIYKV
ncbi:MAG: methyl-accepting chemotaxis protein [Thermodesulfovibrionales bacterium]